MKNWLLDRLEDKRYWPEIRLQTVTQLANQAQRDAEFMQVAELYRGHAGFEVALLVAELATGEAVPYLPVLRYKDSGLRHHAVWKRTWELQRREDAGEDVGAIPAPPKYKSSDFLNNTFWRLRGALDVPKERFISYPHASPSTDPTLLVGWAGWNHLEQAQALAGHYTEILESEGAEPEKLKPMLAGIRELIPWLKQWHNAIDPEYNERMGDFFEGFLESQLQLHGLTSRDLDEWKPPVTAPRRGRRAAK